MFGATAAGMDQLLAKSCARAVQTNACIGRREVMLLREITYRLFPQIDGAQDIRVFRFQPVHDTGQACANFALDVGRWLYGSFHLVFPRFQGITSELLPTIVVDHRVAQQAIKPADGRFVRLEIIFVLEGPQVRGLQNVFGQCRVRDATLHKRQELLPLSHELIESHIGHR